jgi:hypothetical protein
LIEPIVSGARTLCDVALQFNRANRRLPQILANAIDCQFIARSSSAQFSTGIHFGE